MYYLAGIEQNPGLCNKEKYENTYIYKAHIHLYFMDKRTTYSRLKSMLSQVDNSEITIHDLRNLIIKNIGSCERTIQSCLNIMGETGLLKDIDNSRFKIQNE